MLPLFCRGLTIGVILTTVSFAGLAEAQSRGGARYVSPYDVPFPQVGVPFSSRAVGISGPERVCVKWCNQDMNPCDPPYFKTADGRCNDFD